MKPFSSLVEHAAAYRGTQKSVGGHLWQSGSAIPPMAQALKTRQLLVSIALLGQRFGMLGEVEEIRGFVLQLGVDGCKFDLARAMIFLEMGDIQRCLRLLEEQVFAHDPNHELAQAVRVMALKAFGDHTWKTLANSLLSTSADPTARSLVQQYV